MVASKSPRSSSGSPELCNDSIMTDLLGSDTFLRSSQVMLAGLNFWEKTPERGNAPVRSKPLVRSSTRVKSSWPESLISFDKLVKESKSFVFQNISNPVTQVGFGCSLFFVCINGVSCPLSKLRSAFDGYLVNSTDRQMCNIFSNFFGKQGLLFSRVSETQSFMYKLFGRKVTIYGYLLFRCTRDIPPFGKC